MTWIFERLDEAARRISRHLVSDGQIDDGDEELYVYGFREGMILGINLICALIIGYMFGLFWENTVFLIAFCILRKYAGGYHAETREGCFIRSMLLLTAAMLVLKYRWIPSAIWPVLLGISVAAAWKMSPVENGKKHTGDAELDNYKKLCRGILLLEGMITVLLYLADCDLLAESILSALCTVDVLLLAAVIQQRKKETVTQQRKKKLSHSKKKETVTQRRKKKTVRQKREG